MDSTTNNQITSLQNLASEDWTMVIRAKRNWFALPLAELWLYALAIYELEG